MTTPDACVPATTSNDLPELLEPDEVAAMLRTTVKAVYHLVERGRLPGVVRLGRRVLVRRDDLRRHLGLLPSTQSNSSPAKRR
jgi:excisionase family DNA binding protein